MVDALAGAQAPEDFRLLVLTLGRNENGDGLADHLFGGVAENARGTFIPGDDDAVERLADDGIVRRRNDGSQSAAQLFRVPDGGTVLRHWREPRDCPMPTRCLSNRRIRIPRRRRSITTRPV